MKNKDNQLQVRLSDDQLSYLEKAWAHYMATNKDPITRSEFMRRMLMSACAMELGMVEKLEKAPVVECNCSEVYQRHICERNDEWENRKLK